MRGTCIFSSYNQVYFVDSIVAGSRNPAFSHDAICASALAMTEVRGHNIIMRWLNISTMSRTATYITVDLYFRDREKQNDRLNKLDERSFNHENLLSEVLSKQEDHSSRLKQVEEKLIQVDDRLTRVEDRLTRVEDRLTRVEDRLTGVEHRLTHLEVMFIRSEARTVNSTKSGLWEMVKWFPIHADKGDQWPEDAPDTAQEFWLLEHERKSSMRHHL